jgi:hypothetical protein
MKLVLAAAVVAATATVAGCGSAAAPRQATEISATSAALNPPTCTAHMSNPRPHDNTTTVVHVHTQAGAEVFTVAHYKTVNRAYWKAAGPARFRVVYYVSGATIGRRVPVIVTVVRGHLAGKCSTSFTPAAASAAKPSPTPSPTPTHTSSPPSPPAPTGCSPTTPSGHCYEPGEFCSVAEHGMSGVAGDGTPIVCVDNDGWRWEPSN